MKKTKTKSGKKNQGAARKKTTAARYSFEEKLRGAALKKALLMTPDEVIAKVKESGLTGRGGAGFPTGMKWEFTRKASGEKFLICNADEGEPGTFKDRQILERNPELLIEGMLIASHALGAKKAYIYLRKEYDYLKNKLQRAIDKVARKSGVEVKIVSGAGAYICGDETAIMNSIEGDRGNPRKKPPYPAQKGLWQSPTCINNVETLANVALILGSKKVWDKNVRLFSVSGDVEKGGVFEGKLGATFRDIVSKAKPKCEPKALFFGASGGCVPYDDFSRFDPDEMKHKGAGLGSCTVIVVGRCHDIVDVCKNIQKFFVHEGCGKCTPCREGNYRILELLKKISAKHATKDDLKLMEELADFVRENSFCPLGQSSTTHISTALKHFRKEFDEKCR